MEKYNYLYYLEPDCGKFVFDYYAIEKVFGINPEKAKNEEPEFYLADCLIYEGYVREPKTLDFNASKPVKLQQNILWSEMSDGKIRGRTMGKPIKWLWYDRDNNQLNVNVTTGVNYVFCFKSFDEKCVDKLFVHFMCLGDAPQEVEDYVYELANLGDDEAMCKMGDLYHNSYDYEEAIDWYNRAASAGNVDAMCELVGLYTNVFDDDTPTNMDEAFRLARKAAVVGAAKNKPRGLLCLADYLRGYVGTEEALEEVFTLIEKAANMGSADAMYSMYRAYRYGEHCDKDFEKAAMWLFRAADAGEEFAMQCLSEEYGKGEIIPYNYKFSLIWRQKYEKASGRSMEAPEQREPDGSGISFEQKWVMDKIESERNTFAGVNPYERGTHEWSVWEAKNDNVDEQYKLFLFYANLKPEDVDECVYVNWGFTWESVQALEWGMRAALNGHPAAMFCVADMFAFGWGVEKNYDAYLYWLEKSANAGNPYAMNFLAAHYAKGVGRIEKDEQKAVQLYEQAMLGGSLEATYHYGVMHAEGKMVEVNEKKALEYLQKCEDKGYKPAIRYLEKNKAMLLNRIEAKAFLVSGNDDFEEMQL